MSTKQLVKRKSSETSVSKPPLTPFGESGPSDVEWDYPPAKPSPFDVHVPDHSSDAVSNSDWGDRATWILIGLMFLLGLVIAGTAYLLPRGQQSSVPPIWVY